MSRLWNSLAVEALDHKVGVDISPAHAAPPHASCCLSTLHMDHEGSRQNHGIV